MQPRKELRARQRILLEKQGRALKRLGIYLAVVLIIFAIVFPLLGRASVTGRNSGEVSGSGTAQEDELTEQNIGQAEGENEAAINQESNSETVGVPEQSAVDEVPTEKAPPKGQEQTPATKPVVPQQPAADLTKISWPLQGEVTKQFGMVHSPTYGDYRFHNGIDMLASPGTPVKAVLPGKVSTCEITKSQGTIVTLDHGGSLYSSYAHLSKCSVNKGQTVKAGQTIGTVGQPGLDEVLDEPHLHFTLTKDGEAVDPLEYLPAR